MFRSRLLWLAVVVLMCGCGDLPEPENASEPRSIGPFPGELAIGKPVDHLGGLAREPMVVEHPGGTLYLSGYGSQVHGVDPTVPPNLWKSVDEGLSWASVDVGVTADGAMGNSDVDLTIGPDGTLYFFSMGFNRTTREGTHVAMGVSPDGGESWGWTTLSED
jgi:hypothetical protein